jgi:hypothetical protein
MPRVATGFHWVAVVGTVGPCYTKFSTDYLERDVVAIIVPIHARLLRKAHERMLVGLLGALEVHVVGSQRMTKRQSGATFPSLGARDDLNCPSQGVQAFPLLSTASDFLVLFAHICLLCSAPLDRCRLFHKGRFGMAGEVTK